MKPSNILINLPGMPRLTPAVSTYLVPVAGAYGAAAATMMTMLIYAGLFGRKLTVAHGLDKRTFLIAGLGLYLLYSLLKWTSWSAAINIWAGPMIISLLFFGCGVFGVQDRSPQEIIRDINNESKGDGTHDRTTRGFKHGAQKAQTAIQAP